MKDVVIVGAVRTAIGNFLGALSKISAVDLGAIVIKEVLNRSNVKPEQVNEIIMGNVLQSGLGQNPARQSAIKAGMPVEIPALTINKLCGSGLKAVQLGAQSIMVGENDIVVVGGMESMSLSPYILPKVRNGYRMGNQEVLDSLLVDGLNCAIKNYHMGITAENIAEQYKISREEQDEFSAWSQQKVEKAILVGKFKEEIVPVIIPQKKGEPLIFDTDEFPRAGVISDSLSKLKPVFKANGTVTAGNASGINDGAGALLLMSKEKAEELDIKPMATIRSFGTAAVDPSVMGLGPVPATNTALKKANLSLEDIDLIELNEAFAAQSLAVIKDLNLHPEKVNINGGAISLGHPIGASGARILITLIHEMQRRGDRYGLASLCIGGGQGIASIIEMESNQ